MALAGPEASVTCRSTLTLARETLAEERFDLLILDVNLPDGSGLDLLRQVRTAGNAAPVILHRQRFGTGRGDWARGRAGRGVELSRTEQKLLRIL